MGEAQFMLRYKYEDIYSVLKTMYRCVDCLKQKECRKTYVTKREGSDACYKGSFEYNTPKVSHENANWYLFQMCRDIQMMKTIVDKSFKHDRLESIQHTLDEKNIYSVIMDTFLTFLLDNNKSFKHERDNLFKQIHDTTKKLPEVKNDRQKLKLNKELMALNNSLSSINESLKQFIELIIDTRIRIEDHTIQIFSQNQDLIELIQQKVLENNYKFRRVLKLVETNPWWGPTTNAS